MKVSERRPVFGSRFRPAARVLLPTPNDRRYGEPVSDDEAVRAIRAVPTHHSIFGTQTYPELFYASTAAGTAVANVAVETGLLVGLGNQPTLPPGCFGGNPGVAGRSVRFKGWGLLGTTTTPTLTFKCYLNPTQGATNFAGAAVGSSVAITTATTVANKSWGFELDLICRTPGQGTGAATLFAMGMVWSATGFASPWEFTLTPGGGDSATVTATVDGSVPLYFNMSATWSAANAANTITLQALQAFGWN